MEHKTLSEALVAIQREMPVIGKDREGFGYRYATLPKILRTITPIIASHGVAVFQPLDNVNGEPAIRTILLHATGERLEWVYPIHKAGMAKVNDAQQFGAAVTYARRYGLVGALNIPVDDEDDDAACLTEEPEKPAGPIGKSKKTAPAIRGGNPFGIPPEAWRRLDAVRSYDELLKVCGDHKDQSRAEGWNKGLNMFFADRKAYIEDLEREVFGNPDAGGAR